MGHPVIFRHVVEVLGKVNLENNDFEVREAVKKIGGQSWAYPITLLCNIPLAINHEYPTPMLDIQNKNMISYDLAY